MSRALGAASGALSAYDARAPRVRSGTLVPTIMKFGGEHVHVANRGATLHTTHHRREPGSARASLYPFSVHVERSAPHDPRNAGYRCRPPGGRRHRRTTTISCRCIHRGPLVESSGSPSDGSVRGPLYDWCAVLPRTVRYARASVDARAPLPNTALMQTAPLSGPRREVTTESRVLVAPVC